jgi:hypothetical protein
MNIWGRLGISVAIVAIFAIAMRELLHDKLFYQVYRWAICAGLLALGAFLLVIGRFVNAKIRENQRDNPDGPSGPLLLLNLQYWGLMLTIFGIIVVCIVPNKIVEARPAKTPDTKQKTVKTNAPPKPPPPAFPKLKLQGIVSRTTNSSALINGRTYFVGDYIRDAKVISISETNVIVEFSGEKKELRLEE